ncbi:hypothetical protein H1P_260006 [Hyella patelloides LEGE 07179]|uniref:Transposase n=1 Tax=Hyella patelloides LEGE 07179 TaxID=945734 RepID=A0A563VSF0_9CYAN|nr:hypothetical protein H1P_260006 [Hyella patelloides LEGE 07179]
MRFTLLKVKTTTIHFDTNYLIVNSCFRNNYHIKLVTIAECGTAN